MPPVEPIIIIDAAGRLALEPPWRASSSATTGRFEVVGPAWVVTSGVGPTTGFTTGGAVGGRVVALVVAGLEVGGLVVAGGVVGGVVVGGGAAHWSADGTVPDAVFGWSVP
jgi:hypothetical protein